MKNCELCKGPARTYCEVDRASLCWDCDAKVHGANFLVARHIRTVLCHACQSLTPWKASGANLGVTVSACENCVIGVRNRGGDENSRRGVDYYEFEAEDDEDDELSGDDEDDNQVVPWFSSLTLPQPAVSSSSSKESINWFSNGGSEVSRKISVYPSKRMRERASDLRFEDNLCSSSHRRRCNLESTSKEHLAGADGEQTCMDNSRPNWRACAGSSVQIPAVDSRVYYFPQGHLEQSSTSVLPFLSPLVLSKPLILCRISAIELLADECTDEVFAKLVLHPISPRLSNLIRSSCSEEKIRECGETERQSQPQEDNLVSFAKILTPSDANNGGGFSVPRFCADSIFPPLDYQAEPPVQTLSIVDVRGEVWEFRHIYRGTPRRHLLTTGWSKFVNNKKLVAGDSVVFMRNSSGEMFVGIRRAVRSNAGDCARWTSQLGVARVKSEEESNGKDWFSRNGQGRLLAEEVAQAAELAAQERPFEVVYYPRVCCSDFVVKAELVEEAMGLYWTAGIRVKMAIETEDSSRMTWFQGTILAAVLPEQGPWRGSPWRMLQVAWDEAELLPNAQEVCPWQVEFVASTPPLHNSFPSAKRSRSPLDNGLLTDEEKEFFPLMTIAANPIMGQMNASLLNYTFPVGMQGARQNLLCGSRLSTFQNETVQFYPYNSFGDYMVPKLTTVSTDLNVGNSHSDNLSPVSQDSAHSFGTELVSNHLCNSAKGRKSSFQLFGKIIHTEQTTGNGFDDVGSKRPNKNEGMNTLDLSYTKLLERVDVECQRASAVEACFFVN